MTIAVLLAFSNGGKEFVRDAHVHGYRDGMLLIAEGAPGAGLDADVIRSESVAGLAFAETCEQDDAGEDEPADRSGRSISWPDGRRR